MENQLTELEKKIIERGRKDFKKDLQDASKPMLEILKKYKLGSSNEITKFITLRVPAYDDYDKSALRFPNDEQLKPLDKTFIDIYLDEIKSIKERVENLQF